MKQPPLPFKHFAVPAKHVAWMALANAGKFPEKKFWFYPFKTRFLRRHALPDGFDLQIITLKCWCGDGIFRGIDCQRAKKFWEPCDRCGGSGIYVTKRIPLIRWLIGDHLFHEPSPWVADHPSMEYKQTFEGLIQHQEVPERSARRAMEKLMLRYEPETFLRLWMHRWRDWRYCRVVKLKFQMRRVKQLLSFTKEDEVPF